MERVATDMSHPPPESGLLRVKAQHTATKNEMTVDIQYAALPSMARMLYLVLLLL